MSGSVAFFKKDGCPQTIIGWKTQGANYIWPLLSLLLVGLVDQTWLARRRSNIGKCFFFCPPFLSSDLATLIEWLGEKFFGLIFFDPSWLFPIIHKIYTSNPKPKTPPQISPPPPENLLKIHPQLWKLPWSSHLCGFRDLTAPNWGEVYLCLCDPKQDQSRFCGSSVPWFRKRLKV